MRIPAKNLIIAVCIASMLTTQANWAQASPKDVDALFSRAEYTSRVLGESERAGRELVEGLVAQGITLSDLREHLVADLNEREITEFDARMTAALRSGKSNERMSKQQALELAAPVVASLGESGAHARGSRGSRTGAVLLIVASAIAFVQWVRKASHCVEVIDSYDRLCNEANFNEFRAEQEKERGSLQARIDANNLRIREAETKIANGVLFDDVVVDSSGRKATRKLEEYVLDLKIQNLDYSNKQSVFTRAIDWSVDAEKDVREVRHSGDPYRTGFLVGLPVGIVWAVYAFGN